VLDVVPSTSHTANDMIKMLLRVLTDFGLTLRDILCLVCDNASANTLMVSKLNKQLEDDNISHKIYVSYCINHSVHRSVMMMVGAMHHILQPIRKIAFTIHYSGEISRDLALRVNQADTQAKRFPRRPTAVVCDVPTRWNSLCDLLERLVLLKPEIIQVLPIYKNRLPQLTNIEWAIIGTFLF